MSTILGYVAIVIVAIVLMYLMGSAMIYQWKNDKKIFIVSVGMVLALVITTIVFILKGMGL